MKIKYRLWAAAAFSLFFITATASLAHSDASGPIAPAGTTSNQISTDLTRSVADVVVTEEAPPPVVTEEAPPPVRHHYRHHHRHHACGSRVWVRGHHDRYGRWIPGHYRRTYWVAGHYNRYGRWVHGHCA